MGDSTKSLLQRIIRRIPSRAIESTLRKWGRLTAEQLQSIDFTQPKWTVTQELLDMCEEGNWTLKFITELEMSYIIDNPNQGMWYAYQLMNPEDDANSVELTQFKEQFKSHLKQLVRHISLKMKKHTDEAVWIRIAWGDRFFQPNHMKPTYAVHYLQTPYVFVTSLTSKHKPLFSQAMTLSTRYQAIKDANLSGRNLTAIRDLLMRQFQQAFPTKHPSPLAERNQTVSHPRIEKEQDGNAANRLELACEAFGGGTLPQLQSAVYKLETKFRDQTNKAMTEREESFKCIVKFASTNLLESLRHCASSGFASTPVTPLLSSISLKGKNYFVITDNSPGAASQPRRAQDK
ncbi:centromere protein N [Xyrichtys novacula]|uniref:Centromere protein N n=1 Tax=Xyrichtys novacula TaxID=13765 RepID=A0AAV1EJD5_XYRNO|nr:centromere protein N [Xyrichtys novacula]